MSGGELLDHLIGLSLERQRNGEAERPSGVEIEYELHLSRLQDREVGWLFSLEHSGGIGSSLPIDRGKIGAVANETAFDGKLAKLVHRRNAVLGSVILPPGRLKLATSPAPIGSSAPVKMTGTVWVAALAASAVARPPVAARTATRSSTSSLANVGNRS